MATITGLQSPNPYAHASARALASARAAPSEDVVSRAISASASYSPDWMQADNPPAAQAAGIYGAKGEPLKLPLSNPPANEPFGSNGAAADGVNFSS